LQPLQTGKNILRTKLDPNGVLFNDIYITGNGVNTLPAKYWAKYQAFGV